MYFHNQLNEMQSLTYQMFPSGKGLNHAISIMGDSSGKPYFSLAIDTVPDYNFVSPASGGTQCMPLYRYDENDNRTDNITDWGFAQFKQHYQPASAVIARSETTKQSMQPLDCHADARKDENLDCHADARNDNAANRNDDKEITKQAIFHYVYAVLHDPIYREKYALNLKREFPRVPFYADFWQWANWGEALMQAHINYETAVPFALTRTNTKVAKPKAKLKADKTKGEIIVDEATTLSGIPAMAWDYKLGNRSALEWVLDQYKESKPKDPTIREKFNTYQFADYKEQVIDLLAKVCTVSVQTQKIVEAMKNLNR
jgi:predicted helicase